MGVGKMVALWLGGSSWVPSIQPQLSLDLSCHSELSQLLFLFRLTQLHLLGDKGIR